MPKIKQESRTSASRIYLKRGRHYADFRDFAKWGGKLEPLRAPGEASATRDAEAALRVAAARLDKLQAWKKANRPALARTATVWHHPRPSI